MFFYYFCKILVIEYLSACALQISCYYQSIISFIPATSNLRSCYLSLAREVFPDDLQTHLAALGFASCLSREGGWWVGKLHGLRKSDLENMVPKPLPTTSEPMSLQAPAS